MAGGRMASRHDTRLTRLERSLTHSTDSRLTVYRAVQFLARAQRVAFVDLPVSRSTGSRAESSTGGGVT